jgi:predicted glutamine amidotransferase
MCRLFGFRSVLQGRVHHSLVAADNSIALQGNNHQDGWGVAYYVAGSPQVVKSERSIVDCRLFQRISGVVRGETVLAHIRKATVGEKNILNTHPFQYGNWVFAHNGNIKNFNSLRHRLVEKISPELRPFILGDTDSEVFFYILLSQILPTAQGPIQDAFVALKKALQTIQEIVGPYNPLAIPNQDETYLTFILTNGSWMFAFQGGQQLFFSTHKKQCREQETCEKFAPNCINPSGQKDQVNHLIISSEPLQGENVWNEMQPGDFVYVDQHMRLLQSSS